MIGFFLRFLKGLIIGWIVSLMVYLAKRMLSKAFGVNMPDTQQNQRRTHQSQQNTYTHPNHRQSANQNSLDVVEVMWVGMSLAQLQSAFGQPASKRTASGGEIWTYSGINGQGVQTEVTIQNGFVAKWQDIRSRPAEPFAAPAP